MFLIKKAIQYKKNMLLQLPNRKKCVHLATRPYLEDNALKMAVPKYASARPAVI